MIGIFEDISVDLAGDLAAFLRELSCITKEKTVDCIRKIWLGAVVMVAGLHVPVMPLLEVSGRAGAVAFRQRLPIGSNVGVSIGLTVITRVADVAH